MEWFFIIKLVHILSATLLFGTGLGTAFYMWMTHLSGDVRAIAVVSRNVVRADFLFTTPAVIIQPLSGIALIWLTGRDPFEHWLVISYGLFVLTGLCWIPVVFLQLRASRLAAIASAAGTDLPPEYHRIMRLWFYLGWPAFISVLVIFWLMVSKA